MTLTSEELSAILALIEYHTRYEMSEITGLDIGLCSDLYYKLDEMKDKV